jgi:hypothetical protein
MVPPIWISVSKIRQVWQSSGDTGGQGASGRGRTAASKGRNTEDRARHTVSLGTSQLKRTSVPREDLLGDPKPEASFTKSLGGEKWFEIWIAVSRDPRWAPRRLDHWRRVLIPFRREIRSWMYCRNFNGMALISSAVGYIAAERGAAI